MARILIWTETDITGLEAEWGLTRLVTEIDDAGNVTRELGYDAAGSLVHRYPGAPSCADHGVLDLAKVEPTGRANMTDDEFERVWLG